MRLSVIDRGSPTLVNDACVRAALTIDGRPIEHVRFDNDTPPVAMVRNANMHVQGRPPKWPDTPALALNFERERRGQTPMLFKGEEFLDVSDATNDETVEQLTSWLRNAYHQSAPFQRAMLEILIQELRVVLDENAFLQEDRDDVAQTWVAVETMEIQYKAPRPSRAVLHWAASQIPGFVVGLLSNVGNDALTHFIHF